MVPVGPLDMSYTAELLCFARPPHYVWLTLALAECVLGLAPNPDRVMTWAEVKTSLRRGPTYVDIVADYKVADLIPYFIEASLRVAAELQRDSDSGLDFLRDPKYMGRVSLACQIIVKWLRRVWGFYKALVVSKTIELKDSKIKEVLDNLELDVY